MGSRQVVERFAAALAADDFDAQDALVHDRRAFDEDCRRAAFVISPLAAPPTCKPPVLFDRSFFAAYGAAAVRITPSGHEIVTTRRSNEPRPWLQRAEPGSGDASAPGPMGSGGKMDLVDRLTRLNATGPSASRCAARMT